MIKFENSSVTIITIILNWENEYANKHPKGQRNGQQKGGLKNSKMDTNNNVKKRFPIDSAGYKLATLLLENFLKVDSSSVKQKLEN